MAFENQSNHAHSYSVPNSQHHGITWDRRETFAEWFCYSLSRPRCVHMCVHMCLQADVQMREHRCMAQAFTQTLNYGRARSFHVLPANLNSCLGPLLPTHGVAQS